MFEYTHIVKDSEGDEWGAFQSASMAKIMQDALSKKFSFDLKIAFFVEPIT